MMTRVLVLTTELIPLPGLPTVGGGLRGWRLARGLESAGFDVTLLFPRDALAPHGARISDEAREAALPHTYAWHDPAGAIAAHQPDIVVCCSWLMAAHLADQGGCPVPLAVDAAGPVLLEMIYQDPQRAADCLHLKVKGLRLADFVICAAERQRAYFYPWLLLAGFSPEDCAERLCTVTISAPPAPRPPHGPPNPDPLIIFSGVVLPWHDPVLPLQAVARAVTRADRGQLAIHLIEHPIHSQNAAWYADLHRWAADYPRVTVHPGMPRPNSELMALYRSADLAFDLFQRNPERELAVAHRTVDYLTCGLPVLHSSYSELAEPIARYEAGATVDPADPAAVQASVEAILAAPEQLARWSANAARLTDEYLAWDRTIAPLAAWCTQPTRRQPAAVALHPERLVPEVMEELVALRAGQGSPLHDELAQLRTLADERERYARQVEVAWQEQGAAFAAARRAPWRSALRQTGGQVVRRLRGR